MHKQLSPFQPNNSMMCQYTNCSICYGTSIHPCQNG